MIIYGRNTVLEALRSNSSVKQVYLQEGINPDEKIEEIIRLSKEEEFEVIFTGHKALGKIARIPDHQGAVAEVELKKYTLEEIFEDKSRSVIYISEATYEHNIGAIIRSAECAGFGAVILPKDIHITPTVAKISTGAVFHIPIINHSIFQTIKEFKKNGYFVFGIERDGENYSKANISNPSLFIIGGEDKSLSDAVRSECDNILEIPQYGKINSLNMSVAASIIIFEHLRQKNN